MSVDQARALPGTAGDRSLRLLVMLALALLSLWVLNTEWPRVVSDHGFWDFGAFVASGRAAAQGLNPYGVYPPLTPHVVFPGFDVWNPNLNPPISALLFQVFDLAPIEVSFRVWSWISLACYIVALALLVLRYAPNLEGVVVALWAFALAGALDTFYLGQIYMPLVLATVGAWLLLERGQWLWAGILIGLVVSLKVNFLVWPVLLLLAGHWRPVLAAAVTALIIAAIPVAVFGPDIYVQWLKLVASDGERAIFLTNASLAGLFARIGLQTAGTLLGGVLLLGLAGWAYWRKPSALRASAFGLVAALLASPLGWIHYTLFLLPVLLSNWNRKPMWLVAALLAIPVPLILGQFGTPPANQFTIGSVYSWALLLCFGVLVWAELADGGAGSPSSLPT